MLRFLTRSSEGNDSAAGTPAFPFRVDRRGVAVYRFGQAVYRVGGWVDRGGNSVYRDAGTVHRRAGTVYRGGAAVYRIGGTVYRRAGTEGREPRFRGCQGGFVPESHFFDRVLANNIRPGYGIAHYGKF